MVSQFADESIKMCQSCLLGLDKQVDLQQKNKPATCQRRGDGKNAPGLNYGWLLPRNHKLWSHLK